MYETQLGPRPAQRAGAALTHADLADRERYLNARSTLVTLLGLQVVPVINENDTVVVDEIKFGDNDTLAPWSPTPSRPTRSSSSPTSAACTRPTRGRIPTRFIDEARAGAPELERNTGRRRGSGGRGGMLDEGAAAKRAAQRRVDGDRLRPRARRLLRLAAGRSHRHRAARPTGQARGAQSSGWPTTSSSRRAVLVDDGAVAKVRDEGKSPLPIGMVEVQGEFARAT